MLSTAGAVGADELSERSSQSSEFSAPGSTTDGSASGDDECAAQQDGVTVNDGGAPPEEGAFHNVEDVVADDAAAMTHARREWALEFSSAPGVTGRPGWTTDNGERGAAHVTFGREGDGDTDIRTRGRRAHYPTVMELMESGTICADREYATFEFDALKVVRTTHRGLLHLSRDWIRTTPKADASGAAAEAAARPHAVAADLSVPALRTTPKADACGAAAEAAARPHAVAADLSAAQDALHLAVLRKQSRQIEGGRALHGSSAAREAAPREEAGAPKVAALTVAAARVVVVRCAHAQRTEDMLSDSAQRAVRLPHGASERAVAASRKHVERIGRARRMAADVAATAAATAVYGAQLAEEQGGCASAHVYTCPPQPPWT